jgi:hypothetical protein
VRDAALPQRGVNPGGSDPGVQGLVPAFGLVVLPNPRPRAAPVSMYTQDKNAQRGPVQCLCGRFAKWVSDYSYFNGSYDCYRITVLCSRCGEVDIECV